MEGVEREGNTKPENCRNKKELVKIAPRKIVQELNILELTVQDVKLKVDAVRTRYAPELIHSLAFSLRGRVGRNQSPVM